MLWILAGDPEPSAPSAAVPGSRSVEHPFVRLILGRRSHRVGFDERPVPRDVLAAIARCGLAGPSSKNAQPWRFHIVTDRALIREIADSITRAPGVESYVPSDPATGLPRPNWSSTVLESAAVVRGAPACIFVENLGRFSGGRSTVAGAPRDALSGVLVAYMLECAGIGGAVQNMWLAAEALGLKAAFMGDVGVDEEHIAKWLGMEGDVVGALALGYSDREPEVKRAIDDDLDRVRWHDPV
jgi:nitroreductase